MNYDWDKLTHEQKTELLRNGLIGVGKALQETGKFLARFSNNLLEALGDNEEEQREKERKKFEEFMRHAPTKRKDADTPTIVKKREG